MKVKECMCNNVCCVKPDTKISEVAKLMEKKHIGCVPVCDNNNCICGVITDRDIVLRAIACEKDTKQITTSDVMTTNVCTCKENDDMSSVEEQMSTTKIRRLPVCDQNNHVIGILTLGDIANKDTELGKDNVCTTIENICDCHTNINAE